MCTVKVTSINGGPIQEGNKLIFTEFIDPDGVQTYFELPFSMSDKFAVEDELKYMFNQ